MVDQSKILHSKLSKGVFKNSHIDKCFLCRGRLLRGKKDRNQPLYNTGEHVYPDQILRKYGWNQTEKHKPLRAIKSEEQSFEESYSRIKIPCCCKCNTNILNSSFESITGKILRLSYREIHNGNFELKEELLYWANFIFYKIYYYERWRESLNSNRKVISISYLKEAYINVLRWTNLLRVRHSGSSFGSIWLFKCKQAKKQKKNNFDFADLAKEGIIAMRIGKLGFIASIYDRGYLEAMFNNLKVVSKIEGEKINPLQFRSLFALAHYTSLRLSKHPSCQIVKTQNLVEMFFYPWTSVKQKEYSLQDRIKVFSKYLRDPQGTYNFLEDSSGNFRKMPFNYGMANIRPIEILAESTVVEQKI